MTPLQRLLPLVAVSALGGCATIPPDADGIARAGIAQTAYLNGPKVTPLAVLEDSRCPLRTQCVWAGQVRLLIRVQTGQGYRNEEITSGKPSRIMDGLLKLVETKPDRVAGAAPIDTSDYVFGFRFSPGP